MRLPTREKSAGFHAPIHSFALSPARARTSASILSPIPLRKRPLATFLGSALINRSFLDAYRDLQWATWSWYDERPH